MRETAQQVVSQSVFYDAHSTRIFDPQGRVLQLEYAQEATKKGGAAVSPEAHVSLIFRSFFRGRLTEAGATRRWAQCVETLGSSRRGLLGCRRGSAKPRNSPRVAYGQLTSSTTDMQVEVRVTSDVHVIPANRSGDSHVALAGSGMVTDALVLVDLVRKECLSHR